ncbi:transposase family protein [Azospirillum doebereinerae]|uniref:transposase family protein n=1 Tax=Azospirillum doebereinerae TaxID=92933 RepID=UPI001EE60BEF|nr:transposase family protein [Azospirillum doebereinerae]MCG5240539.1 transposase family protein [Azospirillum doebereinerae]
MPLDAPATPAAALPRWAEEPPVPPEGSLVPGSRFAEEQWVMAAGMLARGASFLHVARALGCSRTTLWRAYYGAPALRVRVWWERQALNREAELRLSSLRDLVAQQVERLVSMGDPATVRWAADRLGLFGAPSGAFQSQPETDHPQPPKPSPAPGEGGDPRSGEGEGLSGVVRTPCSSSPSPFPPLRGGPLPSPGAGEGAECARPALGERGTSEKASFPSSPSPPMPAPPSAFDDDAVPGAFREPVLPDPTIIAAILAQPEADGPKGAYPWTLNPDDAYPSLGSAEERRGKGPCGWLGSGRAG